VSKTQILSVDPVQPQPEVTAQAAAVLRGGGLVAFPTETVYGLGANALDAEAVSRIFAAKGRPANNPIIVHVPDVAGVSRVASGWPEIAARLAERFWPGPLTLVLPRREELPFIVTAGGPTVAVRAPANAVAQALLRAADVPVAAPSANRSGELSPTRAEHVRRSLDGRIDLILDGGPTTGGIESTVLDVTSSPPRLLRPGLIGPAEIEAVIGPVSRDPQQVVESGTALASPGMLPRHYAPRTKLYCEESNARLRAEFMGVQGYRIAWMPFTALLDLGLPNVLAVAMPKGAADYASRLYDVLHELDAAGLDAIVVEMPPASEEWLGVRDRLRRASALPLE
jgi:L-threonylcarbamoyladenylate synthase